MPYFLLCINQVSQVCLTCLTEKSPRVLVKHKDFNALSYFNRIRISKGVGLEVSLLNKCPEQCLGRQTWGTMPKPFLCDSRRQAHWPFPEWAGPHPHLLILNLADIPLPAAESITCIDNLEQIHLSPSFTLVSDIGTYFTGLSEVQWVMRIK